MRQGIDPSKELESVDFDNTDIVFTNDIAVLKEAHFFVVAVPTDIDEYKVPNLTPLKKASETVGKVLKKGDYVVYESTVYPGCTEEDCLPIAEKISGLTAGKGFKYGYSPERISPGDKERTLTKILKIVSGCDKEIKMLMDKLDLKGVLHRKLHTSHAFHSGMMNPILNEFDQIVSQIDIKKPEIS